MHFCWREYGGVITKACRQGLIGQHQKLKVSSTLILTAEPQQLHLLGVDIIARSVPIPRQACRSFFRGLTQHCIQGRSGALHNKMT
eukprot:1141803-Pelagomonas_calceolata.AAC.6